MATRAVRERFLRRLYELSDGSVRRPVPTDHAAQGSGLDERGLDDVTSQLGDSGFIEFYREGGELYPTSVTLTASGVEEAEFLLEQSGETAVEIASDADVAVAGKAGWDIDRTPRRRVSGRRRARKSSTRGTIDTRGPDRISAPQPRCAASRRCRASVRCFEVHRASPRCRRVGGGQTTWCVAASAVHMGKLALRRVPSRIGRRPISLRSKSVPKGLAPGPRGHSRAEGLVGVCRAKSIGCAKDR